MEAAFPGRFHISGNSGGEPRSGAFEVVLHAEEGQEEAGRVLWSKLLTGEPSSFEAVPAVADAVILELRRVE